MMRCWIGPGVSSSGLLLAALLLNGPAAAQPARETAPMLRPSAVPIIRLPGRDGRLSQARYRDGLRQVIVLTTPGATRPDRIDVSLRLDATQGTGPSLDMARPTRQGIASELEQAFPGQPMGIVTREMRNAYGPFGLAVGEQCLYAWQWLDSVATSRTEGRLFGPNGDHAVSLRIRACRSSRQTIAELVSAVERLTIADVSAAEPPLIEVAPVRAPVRSVVRRPRPAPKQDPAPPPAAAAERPVPAAPTAAAPPVRLVPSPSAVELPRAEARPGQRRFLVPDGPTAAPVSAPAPEIARPAPPGSARRYITDPEPAKSDTSMGGLVPRSNGAGAPAPDPVSDLPARALQPGGRPNAPAVGLR
jgi:hypothetical protein